jgi:hypothetical protein
MDIIKTTASLINTIEQVGQSKEQEKLLTILRKLITELDILEH